MVMGLYPPDMAEIKRMMTLINTLVPLQCDVSFFSSGNLVSSTEMRLETRLPSTSYTYTVLRSYSAMVEPVVLTLWADTG
jgi:hypothetical protein